jgi:C-terminal processing protease CtpA/Prc
MMQRKAFGWLFAAGIFFQPFAIAKDVDERSDIMRDDNVVQAVGLVRFFHPHEAVEAVDWNAVLLEGFSLAGKKGADADFAAALADLLAGFGTGIMRIESGAESAEAGARECRSDDPAMRWVHLGFGTSPLAESTGIYSSRRSVSGTEEIEEGEQFSTAMKAWPARSWQDRSLVLSAQARVADEGQAALWVRVDGPGGEMLFFDNMADRFIESSEWSDYSIEFDVPEQALSIAFGVMAMGSSHAQFRAVSLHDVEASKGEHSSLLSKSSQWNLMALQSGHEMTVEHQEDGFEIALTPRPAEPQLAAIDRYIPPDAPDQASIELIDGSALQVPLVLCRSEATLDETRGEVFAARFGSPELDALMPAELARLDVASLWPVVRHFYPYQERVDDWSGMLHDALESSTAVSDRESHRRVLQRMLAALEDGHVNVIDRDESAQVDRALLPIALQAVDGALVVAGSRDPDRIRPGDRIAAIDGEPAEEWIADRLAHHSGSPQWRMRRAGIDLLRGPRGEARTIELARGDEQIKVELVHELDEPLPVRALDPVAELAEGVVYINLDRIDQTALDETIPRLAEASGVVFDLRGYPSGLNPAFLGHLMDSDDDWQGWMRVLVARAPGGDLVEADRFEWGMPAIAPRIQAPVVFLTDANAISYSESILGLVKYHRLGTIVGSNTAGSNGNILPVNLPGQFQVIYTGMRVIGPDGEPFQGRGIEPDVRVYPGIEGLREGRDEVLERALELIN